MIAAGHDPNEFAEDTCDYQLPDGTRCGQHIGYGVRWLHLHRCDEHFADDLEATDETPADNPDAE